jgi:hypothetical protein
MKPTRSIVKLPATVAKSNPYRAVVVENPIAKNPLPRTLFTGPFDERWATTEDGRAADILWGSGFRNEIVAPGVCAEDDAPVVTPFVST